MFTFGNCMFLLLIKVTNTSRYDSNTDEIKSCLLCFDQQPV